MKAERTSNPWNRKGLYYEVQFRVYNRAHQFVGIKVVKYFFVTYHLIRWIHGEQELARLGSRSAWLLKWRTK